MVATLSTTLMLFPRTLLANWPKQAFNEKSIEHAILALYGDDQWQQSDKIEVLLDKRVESGDRIPVTVTTTLDGVESISVLVKENIPPLAASFSFESMAIPYLSTQLKLAQSSEVIAIVKTRNGLYAQQQKIKILKGSCI